jgi:hypothetical protein
MIAANYSTRLLVLKYLHNNHSRDIEALRMRKPRLNAAGSQTKNRRPNLQAVSSKQFVTDATSPERQTVIRIHHCSTMRTMRGIDGLLDHAQHHSFHRRDARLCRNHDRCRVPVALDHSSHRRLPGTLQQGPLVCEHEAGPHTPVQILRRTPRSLVEMLPVTMTPTERSC